MLGRLGFTRSGSVVIPANEVPDGMEREPDGTVVGDVYGFDFGRLSTIADCIDGGATAVRFDVSPYSLSQVTEAVREIAAGGRV
jgi:hypothetical protein